MPSSCQFNHFISLLFFLIFHIHTLVSSPVRLKRDFMYVNGTETAADCFQECNDRWNTAFLTRFNVSARDYYDFPFHPLLLRADTYQGYCMASIARLRCYRDECDDVDAERAWSPSNFVCSFSQKTFVDARSCLTKVGDDVRCDSKCQKLTSDEGPVLGRVFSENSDRDQDDYRRELNLVCGFQLCFRDCQLPLLDELCNEKEADMASRLIVDYIEGHADSLYDWHLMSGRGDRFPGTCSKLQSQPNDDDDDPVMNIITRI